MYDGRLDVSGLLPIPLSGVQGSGPPQPTLGPGHGHAAIGPLDRGFGQLEVISFSSTEDAQKALAWWNSGPGAEFHQALAVTCANLMVDGDWVQQHGGAAAQQLLHRAYPSCPDVSSASSPANSPTDSSNNVTATVAPAPASTPAAAPVTPSAGTPIADAASVVQGYYAAINARDYRAAWTLGGDHLGASYSDFANGFADTAADVISIDSVKGSAVHVHLHVVHTDGTPADFAGSYVVKNGSITHGSLHAVATR
jgi:hypothetical protein